MPHVTRTAARNGHVTMYRAEDGSARLTYDGFDLSFAAFADSVELVDFDGIAGLRLTLAVGRLDLDGDNNVPIVDCDFPELASRVAALTTLPWEVDA